MTKKTLIIILLSIFIFSTLIFTINKKSDPTLNTTTQETSQPAQVEDPTNSPKPTFTNFTASFEIFTNGTKRIFTATMYHDQSDAVYIQSTDPSVVYVAQSGITWDDFFKTLPFSLTKECLVTGTKQTFCSNEIQKLRFYINEIEQPNTLELEIRPNDELRVEYN